MVMDSSGATHSQKVLGPERKKRVRRSRLSMEGRDWSCKYCSRSYLKMESLIHHIKLKHLVQHGALNLIHKIRLKNRMLKVVSFENQRQEQCSQEEADEELKEFCGQFDKDIVRGGPVDPLEKFEAVFETLSGEINRNGEHLWN